MRIRIVGCLVPQIELSPASIEPPPEEQGPLDIRYFSCNALIDKKKISPPA
jgi:hypothetical protein